MLKRGDPTGGNYLQIEEDGEVGLVGTARVKKNVVWLSAQDFEVSGATKELANGMSVLRFHDDQDDYGLTAFFLPKDMDTSVNPVMRVVGYPQAAQTSGSDFKISCKMRYVANGEDFGMAASETINNVQTVSDSVRVRFDSTHTLDGSAMAQGDVIRLDLERIGTSGEDDRNGDMCVLAVAFEYTSNKLGEAT